MIVIDLLASIETHRRRIYKNASTLNTRNIAATDIGRGSSESDEKTNQQNNVPIMA